MFFKIFLPFAEINSLFSTSSLILVMFLMVFNVLGSRLSSFTASLLSLDSMVSGGVLEPWVCPVSSSSSSHAFVKRLSLFAICADLLYHCLELSASRAFLLGLFTFLGSTSTLIALWAGISCRMDG